MSVTGVETVQSSIPDGGINITKTGCNACVLTLATGNRCIPVESNRSAASDEVNKRRQGKYYYQYAGTIDTVPVNTDFRNAAKSPEDAKLDENRGEDVDNAPIEKQLRQLALVGCEDCVHVFAYFEG